jgi:hypothetical protein
VSRAHCLDCGDHVVIDPAGRCPEGHHVGSAGARIEGAMGSDVPHPDEPEPWVASVDLGEDATATPEPAPVREIRPPSVPVVDAPVGTAAPTARPDDLLRELHSLGELDDPSPASGATTPPTPWTPSAPRTTPPPVSRPAASTPPPAIPPTSAPEPSEPPEAPAASARPAFDELTALEAAVQALSVGHQVGTNGNGSSDGAATGNGRANGNGHLSDDLGHLASFELDTDTGAGIGSGNGNGNGHVDDVVHASVRDVSSRTVTDDLDDLFATSELAPPAASSPPPPAPAPRDEPPAAPPSDEVGDGPERWSVLADVAELAEHRPSPPAPPATSSSPSAPATDEPAAPPVPGTASADLPREAPAEAPPADPGIDLGNFTARGKRVGSKGKRRLFGR